MDGRRRARTRSQPQAWRRSSTAVGDPNPEVGGDGLARLRDAGISVDAAEPDLAERARRQNEAWRVWIAEGRPFVTYKAAMTLDGRLAASGGDARWVSGEESRRRVHELRAASDAVAVGMGTVRAENPALTARDVGATRQPRRLAFGSRPVAGWIRARARRGAASRCAWRSSGRKACSHCSSRAGPTLAGAFLREGLIDKVVLFLAPKVIGGDDAPPLFAGPGAPTLAEAIGLDQLEVGRSGEDVVLTAYIHRI